MNPIEQEMMEMIAAAEASGNIRELFPLLLEAVEMGSLEVVKALVEKGIDPSFDESTALEAAVDNDQLEIAAYLVSKGADLDSLEPESQEKIKKLVLPKRMSKKKSL